MFIAGLFEDVSKVQSTTENTCVPRGRLCQSGHLSHLHAMVCHLTANGCRSVMLSSILYHSGSNLIEAISTFSK